MNIRILFGFILLGFAGVAQAELVLVANPGSGISSLSHSQVSRIFLGQTDVLPDGSRVVPLTVSGDVQDSFSREFLKRSPEQVGKYWARMIFAGKATPPREVRADEVKAAVARTAGSLSYMERGLVDSSVKVIKVTDN